MLLIITYSPSAPHRRPRRYPCRRTLGLTAPAPQAGRAGKEGRDPCVMYALTLLRRHGVVFRKVLEQENALPRSLIFCMSIGAWRREAGSAAAVSSGASAASGMRPEAVKALRDIRNPGPDDVSLRCRSAQTDGYDHAGPAHPEPGDRPYSIPRRRAAGGVDGRQDPLFGRNGAGSGMGGEQSGAAAAESVLLSGAAVRVVIADCHRNG